jgi:DNA-binding PadR family transcriptional regulator
VLERRRRAVYALSQLGRSTFETHERERSDRRRRAGRKASSRRQARPLRRLPCLDGVSLFLRQLNSSTIAHKVLVCAYFLRRYCQRQEFDRELVAACFRRSRGQQVPSSLSTVLSQVLSRRLGVIVPVDQRGFYRLTEAGYEGLQRKAYVLAAERKLLRSRPELDVAALDPSNRQGRGSS